MYREQEYPIPIVGLSYLREIVQMFLKDARKNKE
jgi:hypothetical protein